LKDDGLIVVIIAMGTGGAGEVIIGIVVSIICLMFYNPYLYIRGKIRARRASVDDDNSWGGPVYVAPGHYRDEDGAPD